MLEIGIPYYNSRKTLDMTLSSIVMQTARRRVLVTLCNDCGEDDCADIIERYSSLLNIRTISTEHNGGAGVARNKIIDCALGDFLMFVDSDDTLYSPLAIKTIMHEIYRKFPDIMYCKFIQECDGIIVDMDVSNNTWVHGKVWKTKFLQDNQIHFPTIRFNEDSSFCTLARNLTEQVVTLDFPVYCWINNKESTVRKGKDYYSAGIMDFLDGRIYTYRELLKRDLKEKAEKDFIFNLPSIYFMYIDFYNGAPDIVVPFTKKVGRYLIEINYKELIKHNDVFELMVKNNLLMKFNPRYGLYVPHVGMFEYFNFCCEEAEKEI